MSFQAKTIIEPFRVKTIESIKMTTEEDRKRLLKEVGLNVFLLNSQDVLIDLLTDSGTNAMSVQQWAALIQGDESYAGSPSYQHFYESVHKLTGHVEVIPTHQGRASERILFQSCAKPGTKIVSNMLFDTTRANAEHMGCEVVDIPCKEIAFPREATPFKGNIDLEKLETVLSQKGSEVSMVLMTLTNNSGGGQPASMANIRAAHDLAKKHGIYFVIDGCRFAENAYFIKTREEGYADKSPAEITKEFFALADMISISAKKDGIANIGGILTLKDSELAKECRNNLILTEGFPTYGGLAGRDLEAIAVGLWEALDPHYLEYRIKSTQYVGKGLVEAGVPIVQPTGGHAIYIDAKEYLSHIPQSQYPGQALVSALYEFSGIRAVEVGSVMFGRVQKDGSEIPHSQELVRLAIPRRVYTQSHMDYVVEAFTAFTKEKESVCGVRFVNKPQVLRHFTATFEWCG